jgi:hypothetical protein
MSMPPCAADAVTSRCKPFAAYLKKMCARDPLFHYLLKDNADFAMKGSQLLRQISFSDGKRCLLSV